VCILIYKIEQLTYGLRSAVKHNIISGAPRGPKARACGAPLRRKNGKGIDLIIDGPNVPRDAPGTSKRVF